MSIAGALYLAALAACAALGLAMPFLVVVGRER